MARPRQKWKIGDIFTVELKDGSMAAGQVIGREPDVLNSVTCAFFDVRLTDGQHVNPLEFTSEHVMAALFCTPDLLDSGHWTVAASREVVLDKGLFPYEDLRSTGWVGAKVIGSGIVNGFLNAYHALQPWDDWKDPNYLDSLLISREKKPKQLIFRNKT